MANVACLGQRWYGSDGIHIGQLLDLLGEDVEVECYYIEDEEQKTLDVFLDSEVATIDVIDENYIRVGLFKPIIGYTTEIFL